MEHDSELVYNAIPFLSLSPFFSLVENVNIEELEKSIIAWEDLSSCGVFSKYAVEVFDLICSVDEFSYFDRILEKDRDSIPVISPNFDRSWIFFLPLPLRL